MEKTVLKTGLFNFSYHKKVISVLFCDVEEYVSLHFALVFGLVISRSMLLILRNIQKGKNYDFYEDYKIFEESLSAPLKST